MAKTVLHEKEIAISEVEGFLHQQIRAFDLPELQQLRQILKRAGNSPELLLNIFKLRDLATRNGTPRGESRSSVAISRGGGIGSPLSLEEGMARLDAISVGVKDDEWAASETVGSGDLAKRLGVVPATIANWRTGGKILGLRKGVRNFVYPMRQFNRNAPIEGIVEVRSHFPDNETAWEWLVTPNRYTNNEAPIDRLKSGKLDEIIDAAIGAVDYQ